MMDNNGDYYFWGMHMGWWVLILLVVIAIIGWANWSKRKNKQH